MINVKTLLRLFSALLLFAAGCGRAYHCYSDCCVDCNYAAPPPLPYAHYDQHVCHSSAASKYLPLPQEAVEPDSIEDGDNGSAE